MIDAQDVLATNRKRDSSTSMSARQMKGLLEDSSMVSSFTQPYLIAN